MELPSRHPKERRTVECGIPLANRGSLAGYAWTSAQKIAHSVLAISVKTAMSIQTVKRRIAPPYQEGVMERLLNARGPVAKMNGNVARLTVRQSWEEDDADHAWKKCTG